MSAPDLQSWLGQVPWSSLAILAAVIGFLVWSSLRKKGNQKKLQEKIDAGALIVDVRSKDEYAGGHFPGAVNIPVDTVAKQTKKLGAQDRSIVVYCASGGRSSQAAAILRSAGYTNVTNAGGLSSMPR